MCLLEDGPTWNNFYFILRLMLFRCLSRTSLGGVYRCLEGRLSHTRAHSKTLTHGGAVPGMFTGARNLNKVK